MLVHIVRIFHECSFDFLLTFSSTSDMSDFFNKLLKSQLLNFLTNFLSPQRNSSFTV